MGNVKKIKTEYTEDMKDDLNISYGIDVDQQLLKILENELKKEDEIEKRRELIKKRKEKIENLWKI